MGGVNFGKISLETVLFGFHVRTLLCLFEQFFTTQFVSKYVLQIRRAIRYIRQQIVATQKMFSALSALLLLSQDKLIENKLSNLVREQN